MKDATKAEVARTAKHKGRLERSEGAMSPSMRKLILSFGGTDSAQVWDPGAYARRLKQAR
jgi:hypothetical protein